MPGCPSVLAFQHGAWTLLYLVWFAYGKEAQSPESVVVVGEEEVDGGLYALELCHPLARKSPFSLAPCELVCP